MSKRGIKRLTKPMTETPQAEVDEYVRQLAKHLESLLPPSPGGERTTFFLLIAEAGPPRDDGRHDANYVSNCRRREAIDMLRETADRLERGLTRRATPDGHDHPEDN